jgi:hypothetical protein
MLPVPDERENFKGDIIEFQGRDVLHAQRPPHAGAQFDTGSQDDGLRVLKGISSSPISFRHCLICPICFSADSVGITKPPGANQLAAKSS